MRTLAVRLPALFVFFLFLFVLPTATRADEIVITSGYLTRLPANNGPYFSLESPAQGFAMSNAGYGRGDGGGITEICPCRAGDFRSVDGQFSGFETLGFGPATLNGVSYERLYYRGELVFNSPEFIIPFDDTPSLTINVPFTMTGIASFYFDMEQVPPPFFTTTISGQGIATLLLDSFFSESQGRIYHLRSLTFNFAPAAPTAVPEPATLILFGTGLTAVAARYRRRRAKDQPES